MKLNNSQLPSSHRRASWLITTPIRDCVRWAQNHPSVAVIAVVTGMLIIWIGTNAIGKPAVSGLDVIPAVLVTLLFGAVLGLFAYYRKRWSP